MDDTVLNRITECLTDMRLGDIVKENQEYQEALKRERIVYDRLVNTLNERQQEMLEEFLTASNESASIYETLVYQQGMRNLFALLRSLGG